MKLRLSPRTIWRPHEAWLVPLALAGALLVSLPQVPVAEGDLIVLETIPSTAAGAATPYALTAVATAVTHACGTVTPTITLSSSDTSATVAITLPAACRGVDFRFRDDLRFTAAANMEGEIGLYSNTWTANMGTVSVCLRATVAACVSSTIALTSATAPPDSTTMGALTDGDLYGPQVTTALTAPGGTATIDLTEVIVVENAATGNPAWVQMDAINYVITQD